MNQLKKHAYTFLILSTIALNNTTASANYVTPAFCASVVHKALNATIKSTPEYKAFSDKESIQVSFFLGELSGKDGEQYDGMVLDNSMEICPTGTNDPEAEDRNCQTVNFDVPVHIVWGSSANDGGTCSVTGEPIRH